LVSFMPEKKRAKAKKTSEKKKTAPVKRRKRPASMLEPYRPSDLWINFDRAFERFRRDFEDILWPMEPFPMMGELETRMPTVDLEDKGDKFILTAEVPGFKKDDVEISICGNTVEISGSKEEKSDEETKEYVRRERSSASFYRKMTLPEEVKFEEVSADLKDGLLEITLPKKEPKPKKKIQLK
jgi:HSP20 family protein